MVQKPSIVCMFMILRLAYSMYTVKSRPAVATQSDPVSETTNKNKEMVSLNHHHFVTQSRGIYVYQLNNNFLGLNNKAPLPQSLSKGLCGHSLIVCDSCLFSPIRCVASSALPTLISTKERRFDLGPLFPRPVFSVLKSQAASSVDSAWLMTVVSVVQTGGSDSREEL